MFTYGYDLSTHTNGFMSGVAEIISVNGNGLSFPFVSPACVVPEHNEFRQYLWSYQFKAKILNFTHVLAMRYHQRLSYSSIVQLD